MGKWFELLHYPSFFQQNDNYNTTAVYKLLDDGTVDVVNTTFSNSKMITSHGVAKVIERTKLRVDFDLKDVAQFIPSSGVMMSEDRNEPNYIIDRIFTNDRNKTYAFAVVTNSKKDALWLLSRASHPSKEDFEQVLEYVTANYDRSKFIQTPHYEDI